MCPSLIPSYVNQYTNFLSLLLPLFSALDKNQLQLPLITVQWFMCIFVNTLKPEITLRIWDMFLNEGCKVLFRISAALFKLHEQKLLLVKDASELFTVLRSIGKDVVDAEVLIATAYKSYKPNKMVRKTSSGNMLSKLVPSPRNMMYSPNRTASKGMMNVPADLQGLGVAHMGPLKLQPVPISNTSPIAPSTPKESALSPTEASDQSQLSPIELPSEVEESASVSSGVTKEDEDIEVDSTIRESTVVFAGTDLKSNIGELTGRNSFVENHSSLLVNKLKLEKRHKRGIKKGEFAFYRSDIALWRSSFRPGLEERHSKMEAARQKWRNKQITKENIAAGVVANTQDENVSGRKVVRKLGPVEISSPSALKLVKSVSMDSEISDISPDRFLGALPDSLDEDDEEDAADGRSLKTGMGSLSLSGSSSPYTPHSAGLTPTKRPSLDHRRASKSDLSSLLTNVPEDASGNDIDDVFDTTYSIDHTFDLDPTISANRTLLPHPLPPSPTAIVAPSPPVELST